MTSPLPNLPKFPAEPPREPALTVGASIGSVAGIVAIVQYIFPDLLTEKQLGLIFIVSALVLPMIQAWITRERVWSPASVKELVDTGINNAVKEVEKIKNPDKSDFFEKP